MQVIHYPINLNTFIINLFINIDDDETERAMENIIFGDYNEGVEHPEFNDSDYIKLGEEMTQELEEIQGLWEHFVDDTKCHFRGRKECLDLDTTPFRLSVNIEICLFIFYTTPELHFC